MESGDISGPNDGAGPSFSQSIEVLPPPPPNPPQMATQSVPSSSEPAEVLPPPPPLPPQMAQKLPEAPRVVLLKRPGQGRAGKPVKLLCNHFRVNFTNLQDSFHYDVKISGEREGKDVINKIWCRKIMDKVKEVYGDTELGGKDFAYDGEKSLFTVGPLRSNNIECTVVIDDERSSRRPIGNGSPSQIEQSKQRREDRGERFKVEITFAAKISMKALQAVIQGEVSDKGQDALRVLDTVLRQHASRKGYLLVRQSFFHWSFAPLVELGGGVTGCRGYHISFRPTQSGLSLNMVDR